jgi:alanine racemase
VRLAQQELAGQAQLMVAVKSNAYGHGADALARVAMESGADALAVLDITTGVALRKTQPDATMLAWLLSPGNDFQAGIDASLDLGVSHLWQLDAIAKARVDSPVRVHLKIDTGLHRNGALAADWPALVESAAQLEAQGTITVIGIWSHLADTSVAEDRASLARFQDAVTQAREAGLSPEILHIAASAAAVDFPESRLDLVRVGLIAYGVSPFDDKGALDLGFQPVMAARARVLEVSHDTVVLGMGYADGLLALPAHTGWVLIQGEQAMILSVEAETLIVEKPATPVALSDVATLWGEPALGSPRVEDWAGWGNTIGDEVIAGIPPSMPRNYLTL